MEVVSPFVNHVCLWIFAALLLYAAWTDFREYLIPNRISIGLLILYPAFVLSSGRAIDWPHATVIAGVVFLVCILFFWRGWMGGGDVKLLTACSLWAGTEFGLDYIFLTAFAGGALSLAVMLRANYGWIIGFPAIGANARKVPYGVAIAAGGLFVASNLMISAS